jgi:predicted Rdx family selenoprotein
MTKHQIVITYCQTCGLLPGAQKIGEMIHEQFGIQADLREGEAGIFKVALNGRVLYSNFENGGELPNPARLWATLAEFVEPLGEGLGQAEDGTLLVEGAACPMPAPKAKPSAPKLSVYQPLGYPPTVMGVAMAPRPATLEGKTVYLVDMHFNDGDRLLARMQDWFAENMPGVRTLLRTKRGVYMEEDPELFREMQQEADAAILAIGH